MYIVYTVYTMHRIIRVNVYNVHCVQFSAYSGDVAVGVEPLACDHSDHTTIPALPSSLYTVHSKVNIKVLLMVRIAGQTLHDHKKLTGNLFIIVFIMCIILCIRKVFTHTNNILKTIPYPSTCSYIA